MTRRVTLANKICYGSTISLGPHNTLSKYDNPRRMSKVSPLALERDIHGTFSMFFFNQFYVVPKGVTMIHMRI
jgi:hypothetical protein